MSDEPDIRLFAFHGNINEPIKSNEIGQFHGDVTSNSRNEWSYMDRKYNFQVGDILYYWIYVQHGNLAYRLDGQTFVYHGDGAVAPNAETTTELPRLPPVCVSSETILNGKNVCKNTLIFDENFNDPLLPNWKHEIRIPLDSEVHLHYFTLFH